MSFEVRKVRSAETLTGAGQFVNGSLASMAMLGPMQPVDKIVTDAMNRRNKVDRVVTNVVRKQRLTPLELARCGASYYRGLIPSLASVVPVIGISNGVYENMIKQLAPDGKPTEGQKVQATLVATGASAMVATPFELIKVRLQTAQTVTAKTPLEAARANLKREKKPQGPTINMVFAQIVRQEGCFGFGKGYFPLAGRDFIVNYGLFKMADGFKKYVPSCIENEKWREGIAGVTAGVVTGAASTPFALVKTRMQGDTKGTYRSTPHTFVKIIADEGWPTLAKGMGPRIIFVGGAVGFITVFKNSLPAYYPDFLHRDLS